MSTEPLTRDQRQADFNIVTSEQPDLIRRALEMDGAKDKATVDADPDKSALDSTKPVTAKSGDDSDTSIDAGAGDVDDDDPDAGNDDNVDDDPEPELDAAGKKVKSAIDKKLSKLNYQIREANRQNKELSKRLEAAEKAKIEPVKEIKPDSKLEATIDVVEKFSAKPAPSQDDKDSKGEPLYATYGDFIAATTKWAKEAVEDAQTHAEKRAAKIVTDAVAKLKTEWSTEQATNQAKLDAEKVVATYEKRVAIVSADPLNKDFDELVNQNKNKIQLTNIMRDEILNGENGPMPELALYFGRNPKEAAHIGTLTEKGQLLAIGAIITKLATPASKSSKDKPATNGNGGSRRPADPLPRGSQAGGRGTGSGTSRKDVDNMSGDDYIAARRAGTLK